MALRLQDVWWPAQSKSTFQTSSSRKLLQLVAIVRCSCYELRLYFCLNFTNSAFQKSKPRGCCKENENEPGKASSSQYVFKAANFAQNTATLTNQFVSNPIANTCCEYAKPMVYLPWLYRIYSQMVWHRKQRSRTTGKRPCDEHRKLMSPHSVVANGDVVMSWVWDQRLTTCTTTEKQVSGIILDSL